MENIRERILSVLQKETGVDPATIDFNLPIRDQIAIDSMQFVGIVAALETDLGIEIPTSVVGAVTLNEFLADVMKVVS